MRLFFAARQLMASSRTSRVAALVLVCSGALKLDYPFGSAAAIHVLENWQTRVDVVVALSLFEVLTGVILLVFPRRRLFLALALGLSIFLLTGRLLLGLGSSGEDCGCFGRIETNQAVVVWILVFLLTAFAAALRESRVSTPSWRLDIAIAANLLLIPILGPMVAQPTPSGPQDRIAQVSKLESTPLAWVVVGTWGCSHCVSCLERLSRESIRSAESASIKFLVPEVGTLRGNDLQSRLETLGVEVIEVRERDWWECVEGPPPRVWKWSAGKLTRHDLK